MACAPVHRGSGHRLAGIHVRVQDPERGGLVVEGLSVGGEESPLRNTGGGAEGIPEGVLWKRVLISVGGEEPPLRNTGGGEAGGRDTSVIPEGGTGGEGY